MAVRAAPQPRRTQHRAHHALPRGSRSALPANCHAEGRTHRRARHDAQSARQLFGPGAAPASGSRCAARGAPRSRARGRWRASAPASCEPSRARGGARVAARERRRHPRNGSPAAGPGGSVSAAHRPAGMTRFATLCHKELLRFFKVSVQTVAAPVLTALLYLVIFGHALEGRLQVYEGVRYTSFLVPGLVMMSVLQNAFANSSSSLIQSKITGNVVFVLLPPLSHYEMFAAYVLAAVARGLAVGFGVFIVTIWFVPVSFAAPLYIILFAICGAGILGTLGLIAGIWAEKFDQLAAFQNFLIMPLTFLSGVFYSTHSLPPVWREISRLNPFFYMIDGFRFGFFGASDINPFASLAIVTGFFVLLALIAMRLLATGYKLRHWYRRQRPPSGRRAPTGALHHVADSRT